MNHLRFNLGIGKSHLSTIRPHGLDFEVDFPSKRIRFAHQSWESAFSDFSVLHLRKEPERQLPFLEIALEGRHCANAIIDLGNDIPISMSAEFAHRAGLLDNRRVSTALNADVGGDAVNHIFCVRNAQLGPFLLSQIPATVVQDWKPPQPISLGWPLLRAFRAAFSFRRNLLGLKGDARLLAAPFPKDRSGIGAQRRIDHVLVRHVAVDSPAWKAGLREGDQIVAINGRQIDVDYPPRNVRLGLQDAGTRIDFQLADGRLLELVLQDYF